MKTYDVHFNDSDNSNNKGFKLSENACLDWIYNNKNTDLYFNQYKGGIVSIVDNESGKIIIEQSI